jgi:Na+/H+-dicarboxylate symporter
MDNSAVASGRAELLGSRAGESAGQWGVRSRREVSVGTWMRALIRDDPLLALTLVGVVSGICLGLILSAVLPGSGDGSAVREVTVKLVSFPGKMFLNLLKMMVLPLISGSMIAGVCALQSAGANTGKLARVALGYFAVTTVLAVVIGITIVSIFQPGMRPCSCLPCLAPARAVTSVLAALILLGVTIVSIFQPQACAPHHLIAFTISHQSLIA